MKISDFIQEVLIDKFKEIQQNEENHYISFGLICLWLFQLSEVKEGQMLTDTDLKCSEDT
jgi:hypothetical protein